MFGTRTLPVAQLPLAQPPLARTSADLEEEIQFLDADVQKWRSDLSALRTERAELEAAVAAGTPGVGPELAALDALKQKLIW